MLEEEPLAPLFCGEAGFQQWPPKARLAERERCVAGLPALSMDENVASVLVVRRYGANLSIGRKVFTACCLPRSRKKELQQTAVSAG